MRVVFFLMGLCLTFVSFAADSTRCDRNQCMIVVDAGSTGSRIHLYAYEYDTKGNRTNIQDIASKKIYPGFATIELTQKNINNYLNRLFQVKEIPNVSIPVYFYATAGMRIVPPNKQDLYFKYLKQWIAKQPTLKLKDAKTISGKEEGIYGWLAVNYQLGLLQDKEKPLVGVMDTGGASVQIVFPVDVISSILANDLVSTTVYQRHINLFVHSFLGLGRTELTHQFLEEKSCFAVGYKLPNEDLGIGEMTQCENRVGMLVNNIHHVDTVVQPILRENKVKTWYAIGMLSDLIQKPPIIFNNKQFTPQALIEQTDSKSCKASWSKVNYDTRHKYLYDHCLASAYYYTLLVNGYGLKPTTPIHYFSTREKNNNWTLGVVLHH